MKRPIESDYTSHVAYTRALEAYCDSLSQDEPWTPDDMAYRPGGLAQPEQGTLMTKDEALKLALEALENAIAVRHGKDGTKFVDPLEPNAITAIKEALAQPDHIVDANKMAQPAQEPVAWAVYYKGGGSKSLHWPNQHSPDGDATMFDAVPLVPQRPWVGLTDDEMEIAAWTDGSFGAGARWANAKLKGKNT